MKRVIQAASHDLGRKNEQEGGRVGSGEVLQVGVLGPSEGEEGFEVSDGDSGWVGNVSCSDLL